MKTFFAALTVALALSNGASAQQCTSPPPCEKMIRVELSQTSYTLNVWTHIRNAANAVEFQLPVSCSFYEQVQVGDDLLRNKFRFGSLAIHGSFGTWNLKVVGK